MAQEGHVLLAPERVTNTMLKEVSHRGILPRNIGINQYTHSHEIEFLCSYMLMMIA